MQVGKDSVVLFNYRLKDESGETLEDALTGDPVAILYGHGNVIRGLETALLDKQAGDEFEVKIAPQDGYGVRKDDQVKRVSKKYFANAKRLKPGMQTILRSQESQQTVTVVKVGGKVLDVDMNHPLAGRELNFEVKITEVRAATATELSHQHAHADGKDHQ
ncbi:MAG: FKBP-type peptidyl-prolyl cis-trans isomerase SlyD [Limisphaerales bacterium]|jgi:FKBP-type peptidyl-prolyl cis-trans isomerase SlyD